MYPSAFAAYLNEFQVPVQYSYEKEHQEDLRLISTGVPSGKNGISSSGKILEITPLFPCRPAILSPTDIFLF